MTILGALPGVASHSTSLFRAAPVEDRSKVHSYFQPFQIFSSPPVFLVASRGSSLLERRSQDYTDSLTAGQLRVARVSKILEQQMQSPSNLLLWAGVGTLAKSFQLSFKVEEAAFLSRNLLTQVNLRTAGVAVLPFGLVACAAGSDEFDGRFQTGRDGGVDPRQEGGTGVDNDGDQVPEGIDCNDEDPDTFPLVGEGRLIEIRRSTTICPGVYNGFSLRVPSGVRDIQVVGEGVILDGRVKDKPVATSALRVINGDNIELSGFRILYYSEPVGVVGMVTVEASKNVQLRNLDITGNKGNWPIRLANSDDSTLENVTTHTHSDRGIKLENCKRTTLKDSHFNSEKPYDYAAPAYALVYVEGGVHNTLIGCQMFTGQADALVVKDSVGFQGIEMVIGGNTGSGIFLEGATNGFFRDSKVNNNGKYGLYIQRNTRHNTFSKNDFTLNAMGPYGARDVDPSDAPLDANIFLDNTPQP